MTDRFQAGERVLVRRVDPVGHTRAPRYTRGHAGVVVGVHGRHTLPDDVAAHVTPPRVEAVYAVRFAAQTLWGGGDHTVTVNLWDSYLDSAEDGE